jgi:GST-like protein
MIDAYVWTTPNGFKLLAALEELGVPYTPRWVDISKGEQLKAEYLAINPNNKIPALDDHDAAGGPVTVFESGAILIYLGDKTGKLLPARGADRYTTIEWVFFNAANTGPMLGQLGFFAKFAPEKIPLAIERYTKEAHRLLGVMDRRLGGNAYLAGAQFTIADIMNVTWIRGARDFMGVDFAPYPHLRAWVEKVETRPAIAKALEMKP